MNDLTLPSSAAPSRMNPGARAKDRLKGSALALAAAAVLMGSSTQASAATLFTGPVGGDVNSAGNWDNGLPTSSSNIGTIDKQVNWPSASPTLTNYYLDIVTNGKLDRLQFMTAHTMSGGAWTVNGGAIETRGLTLNNSASITLNTGAIDIADNGNDDMNIKGGSVLTVNGGTLNVADKLGVSDPASVFTMNGGTVVANGVGSLFGASGTYNFNAGSLTANLYDDLGANATTMNFGTGSGSVAFGSYDGSNTTLNWDGASGMALTITGADAAFYESLWNAGDLLIDGANAGTFASSNFVVNGDTLTVVPEPGSLALIGLAGLCIFRRRRA